MILDNPQAPGIGGDSAVDATVGTQEIGLRSKGAYVLNSLDRDQAGIDRCAVFIPRLAGWLFGWRDSGFNGLEKSGFPAQICGCFGPDYVCQDNRRAIMSAFEAKIFQC